jgi:phage repressor protein C with HTH and peptisase S24 domain
MMRMKLNKGMDTVTLSRGTVALRRLNLRRLIDLKAGGNTTRLADLIGKRQSYVSDLINNEEKSFGEKVARAIEARLGLPPLWLDRGDSPAPEPTGQTPDDRIPFGIPIIRWNDPADLPEGAYVFVPRYDVHVSAGNGRIVHIEKMHDQPQAFRSGWIKRKRLQHSGLMCVCAHGDSMEPIIGDGYSLLADRNQRAVIDGKIYILRYGDEVRVKRLFKRPDGGLLVRSDNTANYPDMTVTAEDMQHVEIIGRVVHVSGEV